MGDWSEQFQSLLKTPLGQELLRTVREDLHDPLIRQAEMAGSQEEAYGLLKQASGAIKALEHLQSIAGLAVAPKGMERKVN